MLGSGQGFLSAGHSGMSVQLGFTAEESDTPYGEDRRRPRGPKPGQPLSGAPRWAFWKHDSLSLGQALDA